MVKSPNGFPMQSPYVAVANKQVDIMVRIAAEFGMTPCSRTRIRVGDKPPEDPFEAFLQTVARAARDDPVTAYARAVTEGQILTNRLVRLACARHLDDLASGAARGLRFDVQAAQHAIDFFGFLRHSKGEWAGQTFTLAPWQAFVVGSLFGWQRADGLRRFRTAYCAVPRKNGKSTLSAGIALYLLVADGEQGAEVYSAATTRDQARIVFDEAKRMVGSSPALKRRVQVLINNLNVEASASRFMPLSSDASSMDGLNVHGAIIDELHAHKTRHVVDVLETATGARRQPLLFEITTAGYDRHSICFEHHDYAIKLLEGTLQDDSWFAFIASADEGDDWTDPEVWRKAEPELRPLGQGGRPGAQGREGDRPARRPERLPAHAPERVDRAGRALDRHRRLGRLQLVRSTSRRCAGAPASAASTSRPPPTSRRSPGSSRPSRTMASGICCRATSCPRRTYASAPSATGCPTISGPGRASSRRPRAMSSTTARSSSASSPTAALFQVKEIAYDPWNATHIALRLQDEGATMVEFRQGFRSMAAPTRELEKLIVSRKLAHGGNPVTRWMAANVAVAQDPAGNLKPAKDKSTERIDGIVALIMAIGRAMVAQEEPQPEYSMFFV